MLRFHHRGESHGPALDRDRRRLARRRRRSTAPRSTTTSRRQHGYGRGGRMKIETDTVEIIGGVRHGQTIGAR